LPTVDQTTRGGWLLFVPVAQGISKVVGVERGEMQRAPLIW